MRAELKVKEVGGLRSEYTYHMETGKTWFISSSNSGGKTSVVRALSAVLSMPPDGDLGKYPREEANKLGIQTEEISPREGFVNVHSKKAEVSLALGKTMSQYVVTRDSKYLTLPINGDPRFLLAGVISNNSKILRQLKNVDERDQPDDFEWAVRELSKAGRYDEISTLLKNKRDEFSNHIIVVNRKVRDSEKLEREQQKLLDKKEELEKDFQATKFDDKNIEQYIEKREKLVNKIENKHEYIRDLMQKKKEGEIELEGWDKELAKINKEKNKIEEEKKKIDLKKKKHDKEGREREIEEKVEILVNERNSKDGLLNLLVTAQASLRNKKEDTKCPLCEDGVITYKNIVKRVEGLRKEKDNLNGEIVELNKEKQNLSKELERAVEKLKELKEREYELLDKENNLINEYEQIKATVTSHRDKIEKAQKEVNDLDKQKEKLDEKVGPKGDIKELLEKLDKRRDDISKDLGVVSQKLSDTNVEITNNIVEPQIALKILTKWIDNLKELIEYVDKRAEEQKQMAASQFNQNIKEMMNSLDFKEFRTIMLNNKYKLYIERLNPKTKEYVSQDVKTLATSEMLSIALILQIALKETYIPDIPFFIVDDIMEDFDEDRRKIILKFLKQKAKDKDWCVVITKLDKGVKTPKLIAA